MGTNIKDILVYKNIDLKDLKGKTIAIDSFNMLFQFLSSIRQKDGLMLKDSKGEITSHIKGLFNRCVYFKKNDIHPIFIFDGKSPALKFDEKNIRNERRELAIAKYEQALIDNNFEEIKKHAVSALNKLDEKMINESIALIKAFGFKVINAPSEAEAQGAEIVKEKMAYALASQDFDSLLFGSTYLIRNLSVSTKRKIPNTDYYKDVDIEFYDLNENLENLNINLDELIIIAILCGTDFNHGGIKGIGAKKALRIVKEYRNRWDEMFKILEWHNYFNHTWIEVFNTFKHIEVFKNVQFEKPRFDKQKIADILESHDFNKDATIKVLSSIDTTTTLSAFIK